MVLLMVLIFLVVKALDHPNSIVCHNGMSLGPSPKDREPVNSPYEGKGPQRKEKSAHQLGDPSSQEVY